MEPSRGRQAAPLLLLLLVGLPSTEASCLASPSPGFTAAPSVKQRSLTSVRVNWEGLVSNLRCADQFRVKWSIEGTPDIVNESNLLSTDRFNYTVKNLEHNRNYVFQVVAREDKGFLGEDLNESPPANFTTGPPDCGNYTENNLPHPIILLLGPTGVGKSTLGNLLLGGNIHDREKKAFRMGNGANAETLKITHQVGNWMGYGPCFTIIDTPGTSDGEGRDYQNAIAMADVMNKKFKTIDAFLLLFNGQVARFDQSLIDLLRLYQSIFGKEMWANSITEVTYWNHRKRTIRERKKKNATDESRHKSWNEQYHEELHIPIDEVPSVYIDPVYPIFSNDEYDVENMEDEPEERRLFEKYTDLLWQFANNNIPFACDGKCKAPSGYFIGAPWMQMTASQEKRENETSVAVKTGERVDMSCQIWTGNQKATRTASENVTITVNGAEIYKKVTRPFGQTPTETRSQPFGNKIRVGEVPSPGGHFSDFTIDIDPFGQEMVGNVTCENGIGSTTNVVNLILRLDCSCGNWSSWSTCSMSCLAKDGIQGQKTRRRTCSPPQNGGDPCTVPLNDTTTCNGENSEETTFCPVNHTLTTWTQWSDCSPKCGPGNQDRSRSCTQGTHGGTQCPDSLENLIEKGSKSCNIKACPACLPKKWAPWSPCTKSCLPKTGTPGTRTRTRPYEEIDPTVPKCDKADHENSELCAGNSKYGVFTHCSVDAKLGDWTEWGPTDDVCGILCKNGANAITTPIMQSRIRPCIEQIHGGQTCATLHNNIESGLLRGKTKEKRNCPTSLPCPEDCKKTTWTAWTECSRGCGPDGKRYRKRNIIGPFHGGQSCRDINVSIIDDRCQTRGINYHGKYVISRIPNVMSWPECLQLCMDKDTCNHWLWYHEDAGSSLAQSCELIGGYTTTTYNDDNVGASGPKICTNSVNLEIKECFKRHCPPCDKGSWGSWSSCEYCTSNSGNYQSRSRTVLMPHESEFRGVTLKCEGYETESSTCGGSFWYWVVGITTFGIGNAIGC